MRYMFKVFAGAAALGAATLGLTVAQAQQAPLKLTLFGQPSVNNDSVWMALERGFYKEEGLDITYRLFPSGTTAFQAFQSGQGDIVLTGDLPSVQYFFRVKGDYRTIAAIERDAKGYVAVAAKDIKTPKDLVGKTVATRVGSTGSWFVSEYLTKNGIDPRTVTVKNLDTQILPTALCGGEIAAFFIWQPVGSRALEICRDHGGVADPADDDENAHRSGAAGAWRNKFIRAPHYGEHAAARGILSSTFETSMTWDRVRDFHKKITAIARDTIKRVTGRDGTVTCRFTHVYPDGPCLYFTFGGILDKRIALEQFMEVLSTCTAAAVEHGGTTTHHHAVGRFHRPFYDKQRPELFARALRGAKRELDPKGMMNPGVLIDP